jgi:hypothetical protein
MKQGMDGIKIGAQPGVKMAQPKVADLGLELPQDVVQHRM